MSNCLQFNVSVSLLLGLAAACNGESSGAGTDGGAGTPGTGGSGSGGTGALGGGGATAGAGGSTHTCEAPSCCVPASLDPTNVWVEGDYLGGLPIKLIVETAGAAGSYWDVSVDVSVPGGQATCASRITNAKFVLLTCPYIQLESMPACDSTIVLQLSLRTSTYADYEGTSRLCSAAGSTQIELQRPIVCPTCPTSIQPYAKTPCDLPDWRCPNTLRPDSTLGCTCQMDTRTGNSTWVCPMPSP